MSEEEGGWDFLKLEMGLTEVPHIWPTVCGEPKFLEVGGLGRGHGGLGFYSELKASI